MVLDPLERQAPYGERGAQRQVEGAGVQRLLQVGLGVEHGGLLSERSRWGVDAGRRQVGENLVAGKELFTLRPLRSHPRLTPH
ncbi:hypothetical protein GCM10022284_74900 [Streptomyces hundungensis]